MSGRGRAIIGVIIALSAVTMTAPSDADAQELTATANGRAEAAAVFIPARVNPNFEFYPAYSFSQIAHSASQSASHGISAGFYPGFLLDAFMDFYGFKGPGRALLGFAESQWPDAPQEADASSVDFGTLCKESENNERIKQYFPAALFQGCQQFYASFVGGFGGALPYRISAGHSESDSLTSSGFADAFEMKLEAIETLTIGHAHSTSQTNVQNRRTSVSTATAVLRDVTFGPLHISELRSFAEAVADAATGPSAVRKVEVVGATIAGQPVVIGEDEIRPVNDAAKAALDRFREAGFDVQLIQGSDGINPDTGEEVAVSGGLSLRILRSGPPEQLKAPSDQSCTATTDLQRDNPALSPGSVTTIPYDLATVPPVNRAYQEAWDGNYPLQFVLPRDVKGEEPVPPVVPCVGVLFDRAVDAGVVLGVTAASARFIEGAALPDLTDFFFPGTPDQIIVETIGFPGGSDLPSFGGGAPSEGPALAAAIPDYGLSAEVARRVKLLYGGIVLLLVALLVGRSAFRHLVRT